MDIELKGQFEKFSARFDQIDSRLNNVQAFMMEYLVTKKEFDAKLADLPTKLDFQNLVSVVDGYAKNVKDVGEEIVVLGEKANRIETWAKQAGTKLGVEYNP